MPQQVVGLGDELHVGVLDAVVHHLDVMAGTVWPHESAARRAVDLSRDLGEDRLDVPVGLRRAAGHDAGPVQGALLTTRDARSQEEQAVLF